MQEERNVKKTTLRKMAKEQGGEIVLLEVA